MASHVLFLGWNRPVTGREAMALELFNSANAWFAKQVHAGHIESFEPVMLTTHGGDLNGFTLVRGEQKKLEALRHNEEFMDLVVRCSYAIEGFGLIEGFINEGLMPWMERYGRLVHTK
jgi:hypothetical protein